MKYFQKSTYILLYYIYYYIIYILGVLNIKGFKGLTCSNYIDKHNDF